MGDLTVGCYEPTGGHAQPLFVADGFVRAAERDGATLRLGTRVTGLRPDGQGWTLWLDDGTRASAEVVIVACGPWANKLTRGLGGVVPLSLSRGQAGRFRPPHAFGRPGPIISDHAHELWIKPEGNDGHYLIGGRGGRLDRSPHQRATGQARRFSAKTGRRLSLRNVQLCLCVSQGLCRRELSRFCRSATKP